jgi:hypothetical protein
MDNHPTSSTNCHAAGPSTNMRAISVPPKPIRPSHDETEERLSISKLVLTLSGFWCSPSAIRFKPKIVLVHLDSEPTLLAPVGSPTVPADPVLYAILHIPAYN